MGEFGLDDDAGLISVGLLWLGTPPSPPALGDPPRVVVATCKLGSVMLPLLLLSNEAKSNGWRGDIGGRPPCSCGADGRWSVSAGRCGGGEADECRRSARDGCAGGWSWWDDEEDDAEGG